MAGGEPDFAEKIVDDLMPEDFDWRSKVRDYPVAALTVAAVGGFLIGRKRGLSLLGVMSSFVVREASKGFATIFGEEAAGS